VNGHIIKLLGKNIICVLTLVFYDILNFKWLMSVFKYLIFFLLIIRGNNIEVIIKSKSLIDNYAMLLTLFINYYINKRVWWTRNKNHHVSNIKTDYSRLSWQTLKIRHFSNSSVPTSLWEIFYYSYKLLLFIYKL